MARYVRDIVLNQPNDFVAYIMNDFLNKEGYRLVTFKGEQVYRSGGGMVEMSKFLIWRYVNGVFHIEAWVRTLWIPGVYGGENEMKGFYGAVPKKLFRDSLSELEQLLRQPIPNVATQNAGMPMNNSYPVMNGMPNTGMNNGNPGMNGMSNQGMNYNNQNKIFVQSTDTKRYAGFALGFSIVGILGLFAPLFGIIFGSLGIIYGKKAVNGSKTGMATAAFIIGIITVSLSVINWILSIILYFANI